MSRLRLNIRSKQSDSISDEFVIDGELIEGPDKCTETGRISFRLSLSERQDLRWYWEDYGDSNEPQADVRAERIERLLPLIGTRLFTAVFPDESQLASLWKRVRNIADLRVEI